MKAGDINGLLRDLRAGGGYVLEWKVSMVSQNNVLKDKLVFCEEK